ncbi:MAG: SDR family oxidoreductase [Oscillospiraceae bacterium]|nr:SDR family oxidoreductase [Oscillospiraceae bacterium]
MKQLNEKVAIVTGGGQGIGRGIALCLAKRGAKVVITGRRQAPIDETMKEIRKLGGEGLALSCDSADQARVKEVVAETVGAFGTVDVLVNNAQATGPAAPVEETTYESMLLSWNSGCIGSLFFMQACFPYMKEQNEGRIINFASATGMFGIPGQLAYASNKEAVRGLTKVAASEWGKYGICVNCVLPSAESPAAVEWAKKFPDTYAAEMAKTNMGRMGNPEEDIAPIVAFLSGPDSRFVSGQSLMADGGTSICP